MNKNFEKSSELQNAREQVVEMSDGKLFITYISKDAFIKDVMKQFDEIEFDDSDDDTDLFIEDEDGDLVENEEEDFALADFYCGYSIDFHCGCMDWGYINLNRWRGDYYFEIPSGDAEYYSPNDNFHLETREEIIDYFGEVYDSILEYSKEYMQLGYYEDSDDTDWDEYVGNNYSWLCPNHIQRKQELEARYDNLESDFVREWEFKDNEEDNEEDN